jgi:hypothetical protein
VSAARYPVTAATRHRAATVVPGDLLLHPVVLAAIVVFIVNDHLLRPGHPGWLTGKLSDVVGLIFFPVLLAAVAEVVSPMARRHAAAMLVLAVALTGLTYLAMLLEPAGADAYRWFLGAVQWPLRIAAALVAGLPVPDLAAVRFAADPTDLITMPALLVPLALAWRRGVQPPSHQAGSLVASTRPKR